MYELMLKLEPKKLFEEFAQQYVIEYGTQKFNKISTIVNKSSNIEIYLHNLINNSSVPNPENLQFVMNTHSYFMWAKEETICLGALGVIMRWSELTYISHNKEKNELVTKTMANLIDKSSRLKYNQFNSFFQRFYRRLRLIETNN